MRTKTDDRLWPYLTSCPIDEPVVWGAPVGRVWTPSDTSALIRGVPGYAKLGVWKYGRAPDSPSAVEKFKRAFDSAINMRKRSRRVFSHDFEFETTPLWFDLASVDENCAEDLAWYLQRSVIGSCAGLVAWNRSEEDPAHLGENVVKILERVWRRQTLETDPEKRHTWTVAERRTLSKYIPAHFFSATDSNAKNYLVGTSPLAADCLQNASTAELDLDRVRIIGVDIMEPRTPIGWLSLAR